jgi:hypothetical protein
LRREVVSNTTSVGSRSTALVAVDVSCRTAEEIANQEIVMPSRFDSYRNTPLWAAVEATITELTASREVSVNTAPDYVIGYLCQELVAKKLVVATGFQK